MGVNVKKFVVDDCDKDCRLDLFLSDNKLDLSRSAIKNLINNGMVLVNEKKVKAGYVLKENDVVLCTMQTAENTEILPESIKLNVVYEDEDILVVNKPQGMVVHPDLNNKEHTLVNALLYSVKELSNVNGCERPGIVHRLDKDTSGLLLIAKNNEAHNYLTNQIKDNSCKRFYLALVEGHIKPDCGEIQNYLCRDPKNRLRKAVNLNNVGKFSHTLYKTVKNYKNYSLVEFQLLTGRTHQIRAHAKFLNHPIVGDKLYNNNKCKFHVNGQLLVSYKIICKLPKNGEEKEFKIDLPNYFNDVLNSLEEI